MICKSQFYTADFTTAGEVQEQDRNTERETQKSKSCIEKTARWQTGGGSAVSQWQIGRS